MTLSVGEFDGRPEDWDAFVSAADGSTHCHLMGWRTVIRRVFGHDCPYLAARNDAGTLEAVLPLVRVRSRVFGHFLVSMPFLNYGGPLGSSAGVQAVTEHAVKMADGDRVKLLELRSRTELPVELTPSHRKITVLLDLPAEDPNVLWASFKAKLRSQIRRPQKEGFAIRFGPDQVDPFYSVFARHMRDLGTPVQSRRLFRTIADVFGDSVWFGCAYRGSEPVAVGCGFRWQDEFEMTWASSLRSVSRLAPNMLLYWSFMERAVAEGLGVFNFGRCSPGSNTHRFKRQWGSRDAPLWWYQHGRGGQAATPSPDEGAYAWGPRIWRHLPLRLATLLGPQVVKHIP